MGTIRLYHSTKFSNLANILRMGVMTTNNPHKEGHGDMLWFTTADDYGNQVRISIDVPQKDFDNSRFEFVNKNHVITLKNVGINEYNFKVDSFSLVYISTLGAYYSGFKGERLFRLAINEPHGVIEEMVFNGFYKEYANRDKNIQLILEYIRNKQNKLNENKKMKKKIKINESQLRGMVRESLRSILLNERHTGVSGVRYMRGVAVYCPNNADITFDWEPYENEIGDVMDKNYYVRFGGEVEDPVNQYGHGEGYPGSYSTKVLDDGGVGKAIDFIANYSKELAELISNDFEEWARTTEIDWD